MSARALWIVALTGALVALIALNVFRSREPGSAEAAPGHETLAAERPAEAVRPSPPADQRADANGGDGRAGPSESPAVPAPRANAGLYASISAALEDHDVPPERRIRPNPELLETERRFAAEGLDPDWSTAAEARVLASLAEIPGLRLVSLNVECRATLCLLQLVTPQQPPPDSPNLNVPEIAKSAGLKPVAMMGIRARSGVPLLIAYLERGGAAETPPETVEPSVP